MALNYRLNRVCGAVHSRGNVLFDRDDVLFSAIGNRVSFVDVRRSTTSCAGADFEARADVDRIALTADGVLLVVIDVEGRATAVNVPRAVVLHRLNFGSRVRDAAFSGCSSILAVCRRRQLELWRAPARRRRELAPFSRLFSLGGATRDVTCLQWSADSAMIAVGSEDASVRVYVVPAAALGGEENDGGAEKVRPYILAAHKGTIAGIHWTLRTNLVTVGGDCVVMLWRKQAEDDVELTEGRRAQFRLVHKKFAWSDAAATDSTSMARSHDARLVAMDALKDPALLVAAFSTGVFALYDLSAEEEEATTVKGSEFCACIHRLSVARGEIDAVALSSTGDWIALASRRFGQLVVWEWQSESFVLKQQGHDHEATCVAWAPDGSLVASGSADSKVKLWSDATGLCVATFADHEAPVTALAFSAGNATNVLFSASLDGTVRCYDVARYRNFRTLRTPPPRHVSSDLATRAALGAAGGQLEGAALTSLAVDAEVVCAGSNEPFEIYVWSLRTGKILDALAGHTAPVSALAFDPKDGTLASASWDKTVRLWNVYRNELVETLDHPSEVLTVAYKRDGGTLATACLDGSVHVWDAREGQHLAVLDCKRDLGSDDHFLTSIKNNKRPKATAVRYFDALSWSADGRCLLAGGRSRFVCVYAVAQRVLVKKFRVTHHRSAATNTADEDASDDDMDAERHLAEDDEDDGEALPGAKRTRTAGASLARAVARVCAVAFSPTGAAFCCVVPGALLLYGLDESTAFAPFDVDETVTSETTLAALTAGLSAKALVMALQLGDATTLHRVIGAIDLDEVPVILRTVPPHRASKLLSTLANLIDDHKDLEFAVTWCTHLLQTHGDHLRATQAQGPLRAATKALRAHQKTLLALVDENDFALNFLANEENPPHAGAAAAVLVQDGLP